LSTTIQLSVDPGKIASQTVRHIRHIRASSGTNIIILLLLLILSGCKSRQLTTPTVQMDIEPEFWIRVLLLDDVTTCTLKTVSPFSVLNDQTALPTQITETRYNQTNVPISLELANGSITIDGRTLVNEKVIIFPDDPYIFNLNGNDYRGKLKLIVNPDGNSFDAINLVPPEPYLAGVVGAEMPDYWEPEALKAQAIAARTYCFYIKK
jgi:peptidoglycan hydrolase-like amidase